MRGRYLLALFPFLLSAAEPAWQRSYFFDKPLSEFNIADFACPSPQLCLAVGTVQQNDGRPYPYAVITHDSGQHWTPQKPAENPVSLCFLNETTGWMVTSRGIWNTADGGDTWRKTRIGRGYVRVFFTDAQHGWLVGSKRLFEQTTDGGVHWLGVPDAGTMAGAPADITFEYVHFNDSLYGIVVGEVAGHSDSQLPDWMDPQTARYRLNDGSVFAGATADGGHTWNWSTVASHQTLMTAAFPATDHGWLVFAPDSPDRLESEVTERNWADRENTTVYHLDAARISDLDVSSDGFLAVAAVQMAGKLSNTPVPGKVRILTGTRFSTLRDESVDYRAIARRIILAGTSSEWFAATDTGMILRRRP